MAAHSIQPAKAGTEAAAERLEQPGSGGGGPAEPRFAVVLGKPVTELPQDLYIPPEALEVFLEAFEGPLDLLLYLIRRQNLDILAINVAAITHQYLAYIEMMRVVRLELAAEYLLMAAMLAEIKSRMLLPRAPESDDEPDPRAELVRRLQEYERFKCAADAIDALPRLGRDLHPAAVAPTPRAGARSLPAVDLRELLLALAEVLRRSELNQSHQIAFETLSTRARMSDILDTLRDGRFSDFGALLRPAEARMGVVVTFLALMELIREGLIELVQTEPFGAIHVQARSH